MNPGRVSISVRVSAGAHSSPPQGKRAGEVKALRTGKLGRLLPGVLGWTNCTHADGAHASLEAPVYPGGSQTASSDERDLNPRHPVWKTGTLPTELPSLDAVLLFNSPGTDTKMAAEAPFPARAACWGAVVIRGTASRPVRATRTKTTISEHVNKKPRSNPDRSFERGESHPRRRFRCTPET